MTEATESLAAAVRRHVVRMTSIGRSSHVASGLSVTDILAVLYGAVARHNPLAPDDADNDRVILSKGHAGAAMYAVLAEQGYFDRELLDRHYGDGSPLSGHVSHVDVPGVWVSTGSLGHGLSIGVGMAIAAKRRSDPYRVFVILSDGECDEGSVWEAALFAAHHQLGPLTAVVDYNKMQSLDTTTATLDLEPLGAKWAAFGWDVVEVDGHDHDLLHKALDDDRQPDDRPRCVIAHTIKGKGVPFMENVVLWHYRSPSPEELAAALAALEDSRP